VSSSLSSPRKEVKESGEEAKRKSTTPKRKNKRRKISTRTIITVPYSKYESRKGSYTIDEDDYTIVQYMLCNGIFKAEDMMLDDNEDRRVRALKTSSIGRCLIFDSKFNRDASPYFHDCISSIGMLSKLQLLDLESSNIRSLPDNIGDLKDLHTLNLNSAIFLKSLPESIGDLKNLHTLRLAHVPNLESLPESIGGLTDLRNLDFDTDKITKLPNSIQNLSKLKVLRLGENIELLPEWIGNLSNLEELDVSDKTKLPDSIQNLSKLKVLRLGENTELLPEWIGNLSNLEELNIRNCEQIKKLPESFFKLRGLRRFYFFGSGITTSPFDQQRFILTLTHRLPLLAYIGNGWECRDNKIGIDEACKCALGRNRFRPKNPFIISKDKPCNEVVSKLWPRLLAKASDAFGTCGDYYTRKYNKVDDYMKDEDSKYWLLKDSMASFVEVLLHRKL